MVGGVLYNRFGVRGPGILAIIVTAIDLVGRLLIIERKHAILYGVDPADDSSAEADTILEQAADTSATETTKREENTSQEPHKTEVTQPPSRTQLSLLGVVKKLATSPRALTVMFCTLIYG